MFDPTRFPSLGTRKALLAIDLQNDFLSPDGALPVTQPDGFVKKIVDLANAFRQSGAGDVIWVSSEFERPRSASDDQIVVGDGPPVPRPGAVPRGRRRTSREPSEPPESDPDAFLSTPPTGDRRPCVQPGSTGAETFPDIAAGMAPRDYRLTKTHYSAFQTGQLLQLLRGRFATEIFICGAMTNTSVYATALAAGSYGYDIKIVDDCCGYRDTLKHAKATRQLMQLTGCEVLFADDVIQSLLPGGASSKSEDVLEAAMPGPSSSSSRLPGGGRSGSGGKSPMAARTIIPVRSRLSSPRTKAGSSSASPSADAPPAPAPATLEAAASAAELPASMEKLKLSGVSSTGAVPPDTKSQDPQPQAAVQPLQPVVKKDDDDDDDARTTPQNASHEGDKPKSASAQMRYDDVIEPANPLEPDTDSHESAVDSDSFGAQIRAQVAARRQSRGVERGEARIKDSPPQEWRPTTSSFKRARISAEFSREKVKEAIAGKGAVELEESKPANKPRHSSSEDALSREKPKEGKDTKLPVVESASGEETSSEEAESPTKESTVMVEPVVSDPICEGDTTVIQNLLPPDLEKNIFERVRGEVQWQRMMHQGGEVPRLVAVQGEVDAEGNQPVYRHPSDEAPNLLPFSPTVMQIKKQVEKHLGHPVNHVLIQFYRGGNDYISEHSDKTIDVVRDSFIANVSLGAERTMVFRTKRADKDPSRKKTESADVVDSEKGDKPISSPAGKTTAEEKKETLTPTQSKESLSTEGQRRQVERAHLPHNSLCRMGLRTNEKWLHAIRQDKRLDREKTAAELAFGGGRISLTFRRIGTFLNRDSTLIWGQGATGKTRAEAHAVVNGQTPAAVRMLQAFGRENQSSTFDWDASYGSGFDVLHLSASPRFFASGDNIVDLRVKIMLAAYGIKHAKGSVSPGFSLKDGVEIPEDLPVKFVDNDIGKSTVTGDVAIMLYLASAHSQKNDPTRTGPELARIYSRFQAALGLETKWRSLLRAQAKDVPKAAEKSKESAKVQPKAHLLKSLRRDLATFASWADEAGGEHASIAGGQTETATLADYALWPVLHDMAHVCKEEGDDLAAVLKKMGLDRLNAWYTNLASKDSVKVALGEAQPEAAVEKALKEPDPVITVKGKDEGLPKGKERDKEQEQEQEQAENEAAADAGEKENNKPEAAGSAKEEEEDEDEEEDEEESSEDDEAKAQIKVDVRAKGKEKET